MGIKKGINIWSFKSGMSIKECIKLAKEAGFEGIELALNETGELSLESTKEEILELKRYADEIGIKIPSLATGLYWSYSYTNDDESIREKAKAITRKQLEFASILGADTILVVPGAVGVVFMPEVKPVSYDIAYTRALNALNELKVDAEKFKVNIAIENVWNMMLLSPLEMRDFIDKINNPYVGVYFDTGNVIFSGYPEQWIKILGNRIKKVHFKDFRRSVGNLSGFVDLLAGDVNFIEVVNALNEIGYDSFVAGEMIPNYTQHTNQIIFNTSNSMDVILGRTLI